MQPTSSKAELSKTAAKAPAVRVASTVQNTDLQPKVVGASQKVVETKNETALDTAAAVASSKKIKVVKR